MPKYKFLKRDANDKSTPVMLLINGESYFELKNNQEATGFAKAIKLYTDQDYVPNCSWPKKKKS